LHSLHHELLTHFRIKSHTLASFAIEAELDPALTIVFIICRVHLVDLEGNALFVRHSFDSLIAAHFRIKQPFSD